jgi:hypothetical protein
MEYLAKNVPQTVQAMAVYRLCSVHCAHAQWSALLPPCSAPLVSPRAKARLRTQHNTQKQTQRRERAEV